MLPNDTNPRVEPTLAKSACKGRTPKRSYVHGQAYCFSMWDFRIITQWSLLDEPRAATAAKEEWADATTVEMRKTKETGPQVG